MLFDNCFSGTVNVIKPIIDVFLQLPSAPDSQSFVLLNHTTVS